MKRTRICFESETLFILFFFPGDVRSLSLPGSYHEKITHLGRSLFGFTRLKQLDLSRNALLSLEVRKNGSQLPAALLTASTISNRSYRAWNI